MGFISHCPVGDENEVSGMCFITALLRKAENGQKEETKSNLTRHRKEKNATSYREKTKLRYCIVTIKFIHFIVFIAALKRRGGNAIYRTYLNLVF